MTAVALTEPDDMMMSPSVYRGEFGVTKQVCSWDDLLDGAEALYWQRRPTFHSNCGSEQGYWQHGYARTTPCESCRKAHSMCQRIRRLREKYARQQQAVAA